MQGYGTLKRRIEMFLNDNPDVAAVTLRRPDKPTRIVFTKPNKESYGLMPESCPILTEILNTMLPTDTVITVELREQVFNAIYNQITEKFRDALNAVANDKHEALKALRRMRMELTETIERVETVDPIATKEAQAKNSGDGLVVEVSERAVARAAAFEDDEDEA